MNPNPPRPTGRNAPHLHNLESQLMLGEALGE